MAAAAAAKKNRRLHHEWHGPTMADGERIFLVDDDPSMRRALARVLGEGGWPVDTFESAEAFLARPHPEQRGCLVLDVTMPGLDGLALQRHLLATDQALPTVFLSGQGDIPMTVRAIKAGASDFLTKPVAPEALLAAVRAALAQDAAARKERAELEAILQRIRSLSPREREVLAAVVKGRLNKQIAGDLGIVEQTVKFHRARIMERLQVRTSAELVHVAARAGAAALSVPCAPPSARAAIHDCTKD